MKHFRSLQLNVILLLVSLFTISGSAKAETEVINLSSGIYENKEITWNATCCAITQTQGSVTTAVNKNYISSPRWYKYHKIYFNSKPGYSLSSVTVNCNSNDYATSLVNSAYSSNVTKKSASTKSVTISTLGDFEIELGAIVYVNSISVTYTQADVPNVVVSTSSIDFGVAEAGETLTKTFNLSAINLVSDLSLSISGDDGSCFDVNPKSISHQDGSVASTEVSVSYFPTASGNHQASLVVTSGDANLATIPLSGKFAEKHHVTWMVNGKECTEGNPTTIVGDGDRVEVLPTSPESIGDNQFVGWTTIAIPTEQDTKPSVLFTTAADAPIVTSDATYYAVYATKGAGTSWTKLSPSNIAEGVYAIINKDGNAFTGVISSGKGNMTGDVFDFDDTGVATSAPQKTCEITITKSETEDGYLLYNDTYGYLYAAAAKTGNLGWQSTENSYWVYDAAKDVLKYISNSAFMLIGSNSGSPCLNTYSTKSGTSIFLVKKENVGSYKTNIDVQLSFESYSVKDLTFVAHNASGYWATMSNEKNIIYTF